MAKKPSAPGNKSQAIRDALAAHPDKSPKEIAEMLTEKGYKLNAQYVSTIKSNANKKVGGVKVRRAKPGRASASRRTGSGSALGAMEAAVAFVQSAGGLEQAKQTLAMLETIRTSF